MVLGIRSKQRRDSSIKVNYAIHVSEIRPWPPSEFLRSVQTVILQWESGNHHSGTFLSIVGDSSIVFNESFNLPLVLHQDKKKAQDKFHKNNLEFSLYMPHKNKSKGQLLGIAVLNLADYGVIEHLTSINTSVNFKKGAGSNYSSVQPVLVISVEPVERGSSTLSKESSLDGSEITYFTDDDEDGEPTFEAPMPSSSSRIEKNMYENAEFDPDPKNESIHPLHINSPFYNGTHPRNDNASSSRNYERSMTSVEKHSNNPFARTYSTSTSHRDTCKKPATFAKTLLEEIVWKSSHDEVILDSESIITENTQHPVENKRLIERTEVRGERLECTNEWKNRVEMLQEELREAAAIEIGLYSVVAEHVSSVNKVHVAARRLSRFYSDACKSGLKAKRACAARAAVSGLVVVSKSCGNDVARLTFWLSNSIMLRAVVMQIASELPQSNTDLDDVSTFISALEKIESWLFLRIVDSVWWQTFTPHMLPAAAADVNSVSSLKKTSKSKSLFHHDQGKFSTELWKKAFKDACERVCPIRAGGHECGCLTVLVRLLMEQLVDRLDTAMFNAILRESAEEMPTDPLSDPITESKVLPILAGKSSFGAGVELKSSIGTWSRWLTDIFGLEDDSRENCDVLGDTKRPKTFKAFRLLHALSDLMMLPIGMLADVSTRREVCPMIGPIVIKRVLTNHVPDEFCPDPIPQSIMDALDTEEVSVSDEESADIVTSFPYTASPTTYSPPSAALLTCVGDVGNQVLHSSRLSSLKKSYNSDDELDELDSPFTSIITDSFQSSVLAKLSLIPKEEGGRSIERYQLLREIWREDN